MDGLLVIDKPAGITSHDVVNCIRKIISQRRVGHAGTLDPYATGILLILLGKGTKLFERLKDTTKEYIAGIKFGIITTTQDAWGKIISETVDINITQEELERVLTKFCGDVIQVPPMVSAIRYQGRRLYELARNGIKIKRKPRYVKIFKLELLEFNDTEYEAILRIVCSSGTYIRTLCADIGKVLSIGAHMSSLRRVRVGKFSIEDAIPLQELQQRTLSVEDVVIPIDMSLM
jgi:tRNA pseudouridine55 synthase